MGRGRFGSRCRRHGGCPVQWATNPKGVNMLWTIVVILLVLWVRLIQGRRVV